LKQNIKENIEQQIQKQERKSRVHTVTVHKWKCRITYTTFIFIGRIAYAV